jgi:hypothetical protein
MAWYESFSKTKDLTIYQSMKLIRIKDKLLCIDGYNAQDHTLDEKIEYLKRELLYFKHFSICLHSFIMEDGCFTYSIMAWDVRNICYYAIIDNLFSFLHPLTYLQRKLKGVIKHWKIRCCLAAICAISKRLPIDLVCQCLQ